MRSTDSRLQAPKVGKPITKSWATAVTNNLNSESANPGGYSDGQITTDSHPSPYINPVTLRVKNNTNTPQEMFSVLRITSPEETSSDAFPHILRSQQNAIYGETPNGGCHESVAITTYYMDPGTELPCIVSGPSPVKILFETEESLDFPFAIPISGDTTKLKASPWGRIKILWHEETDETPTCSDPLVLYSWVNIGIQCEWTFWKLEEDMSCCSNATGKLCDECGTVINEDCPIEAEIYAPKGITLCGCEDSCAMWKAGDVVPALWYEYLCKWVTIPNFNINLEEKEQTVVTGVTLENLTVMPSTEEKDVVTNVIFDTSKIELTSSEEPVEISLENSQAGATIEVDGDVDITADVSIPATSTATGPISVSGKISTNTPVSLSGTISTTSPVTVSGTINTQGTVNLTPGQNVGFVKTFTGRTPNLTWTPVSAPIYSPDATFEGTFDEESETMSASITGGAVGTTGGNVEASFTTNETTVSSTQEEGSTAVVTGGTIVPSNIKVDISELTASCDLTSYLKTVNVVTGITQNGCTITGTTTSIKVIDEDSLPSSGSGIPVYISGSISLDFDEDEEGNPKDTMYFDKKYIKSTPVSKTITIPISDIASKLTFSGTAQVPSGVSGEVHYQQTGTFNASLISAWNQGAMNATAGTLNIPAGATVTTTGTATLSGNVTTNTPITLSGNIATDSNVSLTGTATSSWNTTITGEVEISDDVHLEGQTTQPLTAQGTATVNIPDGVQFNEGAVDIRTTKVPITTLNPTSGTITGETTTTIKYIGCKECE